MNNAVYAATTGMLTTGRALDVTASNLANAGTSGYKRDRMVTATFGEHLVYRTDESGREEIGRHTHGAAVAAVVTDYSQGSIESTGRDLDFAILGDGYFSVETAGGEQGVTRDGSFEVDAEGFLRTSTGGYVLGEGGRIEVGAGTVTITESGQVFSDYQQIDTLSIIVPGEEETPEKQSDNVMTAQGGGAFQGRIVQGQLERSNVNMIEEMTDMMKASRSFQSCAQALKMLDAVNQKTVTELGRL